MIGQITFFIVVNCLMVDGINLVANMLLIVSFKNECSETLNSLSSTTVQCLHSLYVVIWHDCLVIDIVFELLWSFLLKKFLILVDCPVGEVVFFH